MRLSIYMLNKTDKDISAISKFARTDTIYDIEKKYFNKQEIRNYRKGVIFYTKLKSNHRWLDEISPLFRSPLPDINRYEYRLVMVLQINRRYMAISFNNGISLIQEKYIDRDFGYIMAQNLLNSSYLLGYDSINIGENIINSKNYSSNKISLHEVNFKDNNYFRSIESLSGRDSNSNQLEGKYGLSIIFKGDISDELIDFLIKLSNEYIQFQKKGEQLIESDMFRINDKSLIRHLDFKLSEQISNIAWKLKEGKNLSPGLISNIKFNLDIESMDNFEGYIIEGVGYPLTRVVPNIDKDNYFERLSLYLIENNKYKDLDYIFNKIKSNKIIMKYRDDVNKSISILRFYVSTL